MAKVLKDRNPITTGLYFSMVIFIILPLTATILIYSLILSSSNLANIFWPVFMLITSFLTGMAGATTINLWEIYNKRIVDFKELPSMSALLGGVAGFASASLFVLAQAVANPINTTLNNTDIVTISYVNLFLFTATVGLVAGMTFDAVFKRLRKIDVVQKSPLEARDQDGL